MKNTACCFVEMVRRNKATIHGVCVMQRPGTRGQEDYSDNAETLQDPGQHVQLLGSEWTGPSHVSSPVVSPTPLVLAFVGAGVCGAVEGPSLAVEVGGGVGGCADVDGGVRSGPEMEVVAGGVDVEGRLVLRARRVQRVGDDDAARCSMSRRCRRCRTSSTPARRNRDRYEIATTWPNGCRRRCWGCRR